MYVRQKYQISAPKKKICQLCRTNGRRNNDVEIIISGDDGADIAAELKLALRRIRRKRELSYYMVIRK